MLLYISKLTDGIFRRIPILELNFCFARAFISLVSKVQIARSITEFPKRKINRAQTTPMAHRIAKEKGDIWPKVGATLYYACLIVYLAFILLTQILTGGFMRISEWR